MLRWARALVSAVGLFATGAEVMAQETSFNLQLIGNEAKDGQCTVVFLASNKLGVDITDARFELYIIDVTGAFKGAFNLKLPPIASGKQKAMKFTLPPACDQIDRLLSNGFTVCQGQKDEMDLCNKGLRMSSKNKIIFSDDAP